MIIPKILHFLPRQIQPMIPSALLPLPILHPQTPHKHPHQQRGKEQQSQTHSETPPIKRRLAHGEDEASNNTTAIPESDLQTRSNSRLVPTRHIIRQHGPLQRKRNVRSHLDEIQSRVSDSLADLPLIQEDDEPDKGKHVAEFSESEAVTEAVGEVCRCERGDCSGEKDGDNKNLDAAGGGVRMEDLDEGGTKKVDRVGSCRRADVDGDAGFRDGIKKKDLSEG